MLLREAEGIERTIKSWSIPPGEHKGHTAKLECGFYCGSGEHSINYVYSCGKETWNLGSADPDIISDEVWKANETKR
jgi:hypothetical protein